MIERYNQHTAHTEGMDKQIAEIRTEVKRLTDRRAEMQRKLETIKFSGAGSTDFNHDMIDAVSRRRRGPRKLKIIREEREKVEKMNLEVKQSIDAMARKLWRGDRDAGRAWSPHRQGRGGGGGRRRRGAGAAKLTAASGESESVATTIRQIGLIEERMTPHGVAGLGRRCRGRWRAGRAPARRGKHSGRPPEYHGGASGQEQIQHSRAAVHSDLKGHMLLRGAGSAPRQPTVDWRRWSGPCQGEGKDNADSRRRRAGAEAPSES